MCKICEGEGGKVTLESQESRGQRGDFSTPEQDFGSIVSVTTAAPSLKGETVLPSCKICVA